MQGTVIAESSTRRYIQIWVASVRPPFFRRPKMLATWSDKRKDHLWQSKLGADRALFGRLRSMFLES